MTDISHSRKRYDLGGTGDAEGYLSVNLCGSPDFLCELTKVDAYCTDDGSAEEFRLSHTLEHVPSHHYLKFLFDLKRKLMPGGQIRIIQSDIGNALKQYERRELSFRALRAIIFPPADRLQVNPLNQHFQMWSEEEMVKDFEAIGFDVQTFDAGSWPFDNTDEIAPKEMVSFFGTPVKNLGVLATKRTIPRIIHQTWKDSTVPDDLFKPEWIATWESLPGFEYRLWTDKDNRELIANSYSWFLPTYDGYDCDIKRVDAARYFILLKYGGIYADLDFVLLKSLEPYLATTDLLLSFESHDGVGNALMGACPGHPLMLRAISTLESTKHLHVLQATGPLFLT